MLKIKVPETEFYDERAGEFVNVKEQALTLEHSLLSIAKWESKWKKPFLSSNDKSYAEQVDYIRCMTITPDVDPIVYRCLTNSNIKAINEYIESPMTATTIKSNNRRSNKIITSEVIYGWMVSLGIPFETQKWHLNRLMMLIQVCSIQNQPEKKMSRKEAMRQQRTLNAARRAKTGSRG